MKTILAAILSLVALAGMALAETRLLMVDQRGCHYCELWDAEVGGAYGRTDEGRAAPLRRVDIRAIPSDVRLTGRVLYTPTFVLLVDGAEAGRIEGYPGEAFFYGMLGRMIGEAS